MTLEQRQVRFAKTSKSKVLVVEDDPEINQAYRENLSDHFQVITVRTGSGALSVVKTTNDIDLVLLDYMLPDMTGIDVLKEIKRSLPSVPIILVTGHGTEDIAIRSFRSGVVDYIKKPFRFPELISRMTALVSCAHGTVASPGAHKAPGRAESAPAAASHQNDVKMQNVLRYINENYIADIDLEGVARIACMSPPHFSRLFRKAYGTGFKEHLHRKRIEKATELLRNPALTVGEIAFAVGYGDLTHFERIFKKTLGSTPSAYRNNPPKEQSS